MTELLGLRLVGGKLDLSVRELWEALFQLVLLLAWLWHFVSFLA